MHPTSPPVHRPIGTRVVAIAVALVLPLAGALAAPLTARAADPGTLHVTVSALTGGAPLEGADVQLHYANPFQLVTSTSTDSAGAADFTTIANDDYTVTVYFSGYAYQSKAIRFDGSGLDLNFALSTATSSITGTVLDESLSPIPDATVSANGALVPGFGGGFAFVNPDGSYSVTGLGADTYNVTVSAPGYGEFITEIILTEGQAYVLEVELVETIVETVSGTVRDFTTNAPIGSIKVNLLRITPSGPEGLGIATTDGAGAFSIDVPVGEDYTIQFFDDRIDGDTVRGYETLYLGRALTYDQATLFDLVNGVPGSGKDIALKRGGTINAHVDLQAADGVAAYSPGGGWPGVTVYRFTNGSWQVIDVPWQFGGFGGFGDVSVFGLPEGSYRVSVEDHERAGTPRAFTTTFWSAAADIDTASDITLTPGSTRSDIDIVVRFPYPTTAATPIATVDLAPSAEGEIVPESAVVEQGQTLEVTVGTDYVGEWVAAFAHSDPVELGGWSQVRTDGIVEIPFSGDVPVGEHSLALQLKDDTLLGWADLTITESLDPIVDRLSGLDRFSTAAAVSQEFKNAEVVYIANGRNYPDALSAAPAAAFRGAPLLLTERDSVPAVIAAEIVRLRPDRILVVGGTAVVAPAVVTALEGLYPGTQVQRLAGSDRYETSRVVTEDAFGTAGAAMAFIATGTNFPDALAASAAAAMYDGPVVLVNGAAESVDNDTLSVLDTLGAAEVLIAGGEGVVSPGIEESLVDEFGVDQVKRLAGDDRYGTSIAINAHVFSTSSTLYLAVGTGYADALAGAALAGTNGAPLYVVPGTCVPSQVLNAIADLGAINVVLFGGTSALSQAVADLVSCG